MFGLWIVGILLILNVSHQSEILSEEKDICRLFPDNTKMRKPGYCNKVITCTNHTSFVDPKDCPKFASTSGTCVLVMTDTYCSDPCKVSSPTFVSDSKNCEGWYKCNGKTSLGSGYCPSEMHFNGTSQSCVYSSKSTCVATYEVCDVAPPKQPYKDEEYCNRYYQCETSLIGVTAVSYNCTDGKYFDVDSGTCKNKSLVSCEKHPIPDDVCGTKKLPKRNVFVSDGATCRGYYYCKDPGTSEPDTQPPWGQCEQDKFFKESTQVCLTRTHVTCNEDRCDGRESGYELSGTYGCRNYLVCKNNVTVTEEYCGPNSYFNAEKEECTSQKISYPACS